MKVLKVVFHLIDQLAKFTYIIEEGAERYIRMRALNGTFLVSPIISAPGG